MDTNDMKIRETENMRATSFEALAFFPVPLQKTQCVIYKHEILVCGSIWERSCYSYHILKNEYRAICSYPKGAGLNGHCVVELINNSQDANAITLLSFGGQGKKQKKHTLMMKYVSVWDNSNEIKKMEHCNEWIPFVDKDNKPVSIGRNEDDYTGARAFVGGSKNHLLFITHCPNNIHVFDLNTFQHVKQANLPIDDACIQYHCFVPKIGKGSARNFTDEKVHEMLLFYKNVGLSIEYDEDNNVFQFHKVWVCTSIRQLYSYGYICINGFILFFGGDSDCSISTEIHRYSITENTWMKFENNLPSPLTHLVAVLHEHNMFLHIIGGYDGDAIESVHMKTNVKEWLQEETEKEIQWETEEEEKKYLEKIKNELIEMKEDFDVKKWKRNYNDNRILDSLIIYQNGMDRGFQYHYFEIHSGTFGFMKYFRPLKILEAHTGIVYGVRFSPDGSKILSHSEDGTIVIWDAKLGKQIQVLKGHVLSVYDAQFSPDGNMVVSCSLDRTIRLWDVKSGSEIRMWRGHSNSITSTEFSPDGKIVVSGSCDQTIRLWDIQSGQEIQKMEGHFNWVNDVEFSSDGQRLVSSSSDDTIGIWDVKSGELINTLVGHLGYVMTAQFSPCNRFIVSCSSDGTIKIWDDKTKKELKSLTGHSATIRDVQFFPDGQTVVSCSLDKTIRLWDVQLGVEIQKLEGSANYVIGVDISPDGNTVVSSGSDKTIRLWGAF
ncbi:G-protein beta WD-40 repeats containing protein [Reticulomyxa filosa]|uniref:G-protein beta WD-40 repeats containing protein n=1 Tax=Reticulomyxa filosa TaxID=46433 RepID=X6NVF4_RETFI|nr:G-protein beta WD-40 repeats containing protein [Reticulomyxa filosa]|eukprot:ETO29784.1 G-protein beta WD-40 repeats containing protein [Reticulomyxa filosa]